MVKIVAISDQHGNLPKIPETDLLLICGDITPTSNHHLDFQAHWLDTEFRWWLRDLPAKHIVGIGGNHDYALEKGLYKQFYRELPWTYLEDSAATIDSLRIYGTPWQPFFFDWAWNLYEPDLKKKFDLIPEGLDILMCHGPPYGYGDKAPRVNADGYENVGSPSLLERIKLVKPKLVCYGHIHENPGRWQVGESLLSNVALLDHKYRMVYEPQVFYL